MTPTDTEIANESVDLLSQLIRNECVNDGTPESGFESRSVDLLAQYLGDTGLDLERYVAQPGRENLVARIEGSDPTAPTLLLMGHTDVVPANPDGWRRDPFGGEVVDGEVWGRGAVDMLNLTATMAVAFRALARTGFRPRGTLVYLAVADEENLGTWGAEHLLDHEHDAVKADYVVTGRAASRCRVRAVLAFPSSWARRVRIGAVSRCGEHRVTRRNRSAPTTRWSRPPRS